MIGIILYCMYIKLNTVMSYGSDYFLPYIKICKVNQILKLKYMNWLMVMAGTENDR